MGKLTREQVEAIKSAWVRTRPDAFKTQETKMRVPSEGDLRIIKGLVNQIGLYETLSLIEAVCVDKADRLRNIQRGDIADLWHKAGCAIVEASMGEAVQAIEKGNRGYDSTLASYTAGTRHYYF